MPRDFYLQAFSYSFPSYIMCSHLYEIIKIRSEINEKEMKETIAKINKTKSWFSEKINKIDKPDRKSVV